MPWSGSFEFRGQCSRGPAQDRSSAGPFPLKPCNDEAATSARPFYRRKRWAPRDVPEAERTELLVKAALRIFQCI